MKNTPSGRDKKYVNNMYSNDFKYVSNNRLNVFYR